MPASSYWYSTPQKQAYLQTDPSFTLANMSYLFPGRRAIHRMAALISYLSSRHYNVPCRALPIQATKSTGTLSFDGFNKFNLSPTLLCSQDKVRTSNQNPHLKAGMKHCGFNLRAGAGVYALYGLTCSSSNSLSL
jgi:hypothetical protein